MRVRDLIDNIKSISANFLGSEYHELSNVYEIEKNARLETELGYGVLAESITLVDGNLGFNTIDQNFTIVVTDYYISTSDGDLEKQDAVIGLLDKVQDLYTDIVEKKANAPSTVIIINDMSVDIEELDEQKSVVARMTFNVKYRNRLKN